MPNTTKKKQLPFHIITGILIAAVIVLLCVPAGIRYVHRMEARQVLRHGKNLYLAVEVTAIQWETVSGKFYDGSRSSGLSKSAEGEVSKLSLVPGSFRVQAWDVRNESDRELWYYEDGYVARYSYANGADDWSVYRADKVLD